MADNSRLPDLEQLIFAGDEAAWSLADWQWDPLALTAAPAEGRVPKRARTGAGAPAACTSIFAAGGAAQGCSACPIPALPAAAGSAEQCGGAEERNATAAQQADTACGSEGRGARRGSASLLCRDAAFHASGQLAEATAPAAHETAHAAPGVAQAPREATRADNGVPQGQEPAGVSSIAESGLAGAAAPAASAGGGPRCQVESCRRELAGLSAYHQKCRICEVHLKAPCFERAGLPQRFCQRCGRCHELGAFQGAKRSCREQLAKHNARRRRAQDRSGDANALQFSGAGASMDLLPFPGQPLPDGGQAAALQSLGLGALGLGSLFPDAGGQACVVGVPVPGAGGGAWAAPDQALLAAPQGQVATALDAGEARGGEGEAVVGAAGGEAPWPASSLAGALAQMCGAGAGAGQGAPVAAGYQAAGLVVRLSVKLFNCTPAQLPAGLREQLCGWLNSTPACAEGFIRPGCLHITFQAHVDVAAAERAVAAGAAGAAAHLLAQGAPWATAALTVQAGSRPELALVRGGRVEAVWDAGLGPGSGPGPCVQGSDPAARADGCPDAEADGSWSGGAAGMPQIDSIAPAVLLLGAPQGTGAGGGEAGGGGWADLQVAGRGLASWGCSLVCRSQGRCLDARVVDAWDVGDRQDVLRVRVPVAGLGAGLAWLEPARAALLGAARPVLLLPAGQAALAAEVRALVGRAVNPDPEPQRQGPLAPAGGREGRRGPGSSVGVAGAGGGAASGRAGAGSASFVQDRDVGAPAEAQRCAARACDAFLAEVGIVLGTQHRGAQQGPGGGALGFRDSNPAVARVARRLLAFACDAGAPNLAEAVLPAAAALMPPGAAVAAVEAEPVHGVVPGSAVGSAPRSLLARAVRSGSGAMVDALLRWGGTTGHAWRADAAEPDGLTPLHLAALAADGSAALRLMRDAVPPGAAAGARAWFAAAAPDGLTPADFAAHVGRGALNVAAARLLGLDRGIGSGLGSGGGSCGCGSSCPVCSGPKGCRCGTHGFMCGFGCDKGAGGGAPSGGSGGGHGAHSSSSSGCCGTGSVQAPACCP